VGVVVVERGGAVQVLEHLCAIGLLAIADEAHHDLRLGSLRAVEVPPEAREGEGGEHPDDRDHDEELDQREATLRSQTTSRTHTALMHGGVTAKHRAYPRREARTSMVGDEKRHSTPSTLTFLRAPTRFGLDAPAGPA